MENKIFRLVAAGVLIVAAFVIIRSRRSARPVEERSSPGTAPDPRVGPDPSAAADPKTGPDANAGPH
jgi:hypothetical protein